MPLLTNDLIVESGVTAILGYLVVFFGLALLMLVVILIGKLFGGKKVKNKISQPVSDAEAAPAVPAPAPTAPGAAGEVKLHNVDPKTAAMLMAIVADKMQKPLSELRFISIKEVD